MSGIATTDEYTEGCNGLRHYSTCVLNVRILTIVQGLAVLSGAAWLLKDERHELALCAALFGLLFTALLYSYQRNYWFHFSAILERVLEIESHRESSGKYKGPWTQYSEQRKSRHRRIVWSASAVHGPFLLLLLTFLSVAAYELIVLLW